jgi:hypothetical protein
VQQQIARRALAWLLYVLGGRMSVAFLAVVMPVSSMAAISNPRCGAASAVTVLHCTIPACTPFQKGHFDA